MFTLAVNLSPRLLFSPSHLLRFSTELFENPGKTSMYSYPAMTKTMRGAEVPGTPIQTFILHVNKGQFTDSEIVVMLGTLVSLVVISCIFVCCFLASVWLKDRN